MATPQSSAESTALITGASAGIGYELTKIFARKGYHLVLVARNEMALAQLAEEMRTEFGVTVTVIPKDLSVPAAAEEIVTALRQNGSSVDVLVNNAGFDVYGNFWETDLTREVRMIQVNLVTLTRLTKLLLGGMVDRGRGRILNLGSIGSFASSPLNAVYSATKAYVLSFSEAIAEELQGSGVSVTCLCPGPTLTEFQRRAQMDSVRIIKFGAMNAGEVAETGYRALMAGKRVAIPGLTNRIQIFFLRFLPRFVITKISKFMLQEV